MSFFVISSALVTAILIWLAIYSWRAKNRIELLTAERDDAVEETRTLEKEFVILRNLPYSTFSGCGRWNAVVANAIANYDKPARRIPWGRPFDDHILRQEARALEVAEESGAELGPEVDKKRKKK